MHRAYGWAARGERARLIQQKRGKKLTVIGAIALDGVRGISVLEGSMKGDDFNAYLRDELGPNLREGDIVVMDQLRTHKVDGVVELLEARGATALFLPRYSPEFNPIEMCWSVLKARVRGWAPRAVSRLRSTIAKAWEQVDATLCRGWIRHCGYTVPST